MSLLLASLYSISNASGTAMMSCRVEKGRLGNAFWTTLIASTKALPWGRSISCL